MTAMTRNAPACELGCDQCFYCDMPIAGRHEHDHFPIPARLGGDHVVPTCLNCHSLKDRVLLADWPTADLFDALREMPPRGRILLAKLFTLLLDEREGRAA